MQKFNYSLNKNGFYGKMFYPKNSSKKCVCIAFTGSDGNFDMACMYAEYFQSIGLPTLAVAYWKQKGLPMIFKGIPIESIKNAIDHLKREGYEKVIVSGISKGGELSLLAGSLLNGIDGIIAVSPMFMVCGGFDGFKNANGSSWSYEGKELPYTNGDIRFSRIFKNFFKNKEYSLDGTYDMALKNPNPDSIIKVENIRCPILLISAEYDSIWPSRTSCEKVLRRLKENHFTYPVEHLNYKYLSHFAVPVYLPASYVFAVERKYKKECAETRNVLDQEIRRWLHEIL